MASHCPPSPGFQLNSSFLLPSQKEAHSAASPSLHATVFLTPPVIPKAVAILHTDGMGKPLQPGFLPFIAYTDGPGCGTWRSKPLNIINSSLVTDFFWSQFQKHCV